VKILKGQVSAVIATLGGPSLRKTIEHLNRGTVVPQKILICIPEPEAQRLETFPFPNVMIIQTPCRGQVAQRAYGFRLAKGDFVLQLDSCFSELDLDDLLKSCRNFINIKPNVHDLQRCHSN
jgi:hypothetical protein